MDIITFSIRPDAYRSNQEWRTFITARPDLFDPEESKKSFLCDAYFVDLEVPPLYLVNQTTYWFGLFSHQRETFLWKGMLEISLTSDDADVETFLAQGGLNATQA